MATKLKISQGKKVGTKKVAKLATGLEQAQSMVSELYTKNSAIEKLSLELKTLQAPYMELKEKFLDYVDMDVPSTDKITVTDGDHIIEVGSRTQIKVMNDDSKDDLIMALEEIKEGLALEGASWPVKFLAAYLTEDQMMKFFNIKMGNRRVTIKG